MNVCAGQGRSLTSVTRLKSPRAQFSIGMDPTAQWEDGSNIMSTKANCEAILCGAESSGPRGQYNVLSAETEKEACCLNTSLITFSRNDSTGALCLLGHKVLDLHPLYLSALGDKSADK